MSDENRPATGDHPGSPYQQARHAQFHPFQGNPRRRTLLLLVCTGLAAGGVIFALDSRGPASAEQSGSGSGTKVTSYYVSADGDDTAAGTSPQTAWRTLARADEHIFKPGEQLLLRGGDRFSGHLTFKAGSAGNGDKPVRVDSFGTGRATIVAKDSSAISVYNTAGLELSDLVLTGPGADRSVSAGLDVYSDLVGADRLAHVRVTRVDASGFRDGIAISAIARAAGFRDVEVRDSRLHDNRDAGFVSYGTTLDPAAPRYAVQDLRLSGVWAYKNLGNAKNHTSNSGSGIAVGSTDGALVEGCVAYGNGALGQATNGPVGIWAYDSTQVVIQHNVSHDNHTGGHSDGGGFDLDRNTTHSVMQANLSYGNDGPGYLYYSAVATEPSSHNTLRFNISVDDAHKIPTYGSVDISGWLSDIDVYNNTLVQTKPGSKTVLLKFAPHLKRVTARNNLIVSSGGPVVTALQKYTTGEVLLQGNDYYAPTGKWQVNWDKKVYTQLPAWRAATHQELSQGKPSATIAAPGLLWRHSASWDPTNKRVPELPPGSGLWKAGLDLNSLFGTDIGTADFFGSPVTARTAVGAGQPAADPSGAATGG